MASYVPAKKGAEYIGYVSLPSQANTKVFQANPTLASGDAKISKDGGAFANLTNLPAVTPASGKAVKFVLTTTETDCDQCVVLFSDAAGAEWCDVSVPLQFTARQVDDLCFPTTSGRSLDVTAGGCAGIDWANVENPTSSVGLSNTQIASVSGAVGSVTGAVGSVTGAVGSVTGNVGGHVVGNVQGSVNSVSNPVSVGAGGIPVGAFASGAITADAIASDAIGAAELAAGAIGADEFAQAAADKVWASASRTLTSVVGLKKNTARPYFPFLMRSSSDHVTPVEALTVQARRLIDNGTWADCANTVVEKGSGAYSIDLDASDLNGDNILFRFTAAGADPCFFTVATST